MCGRSDVKVQLIGAVCEWCVASDAVTTALLAFPLLRLTTLDAGGGKA